MRPDKIYLSRVIILPHPTPPAPTMRHSKALAQAPWPNSGISQTIIRHCSKRHPLPLNIRPLFPRHRLGRLYARPADAAAAAEAYYSSSSFTPGFTRFAA